MSTKAILFTAILMQQLLAISDSVAQIQNAQLLYFTHSWLVGNHTLLTWSQCQLRPIHFQLFSPRASTRTLTGICFLLIAHQCRMQNTKLTGKHR